MTFLKTSKNSCRNSWLEIMRATSTHLKTVWFIYFSFVKKTCHQYQTSSPTRSSSSHRINIQDTKTVAIAKVEGCRDLSWTSCQLATKNGSMKRPGPCESCDGQGMLWLFFVWLNQSNLSNHHSNLIGFATLCGVQLLHLWQLLFFQLSS